MGKDRGGLVVRREGGRTLGTIVVGAGTPEEARAMADAYLARRGYLAEYVGTRGGTRVKVGVMGLRRYEVVYRLVGP